METIKLTCGWCHGDPNQMLGVQGAGPCSKCNGEGKVRVLKKEVENYSQDDEK